MVAAPAVGVAAVVVVVAVVAVVARQVAVAVHRVAVVAADVVVADVDKVLAVVAAVAAGLCVADLGHASGAVGVRRVGRLLRGQSTALVPINSNNLLLLGADLAAVAWDSLP